MFDDYTPKEGYGLIYLYTLDNGEKYIGQTIFNLKRRHKQHMYNNSTLFDTKLKKHDFELTVISEVPREELDDEEIKCIKDYNTLYPNGLNLAEGGNVNRNTTQYVRDKLSKAAKGRKVSEETRKRISEKLRGQEPWNKGVMTREETKKKLSAALKGRCSEGTRKNLMKIADERRGKKANPEWSKKARETLIKKGYGVRVMCIETGEVYETQGDAARAIGMSVGSVSNSARYGYACGEWHFRKV